MLNWHQVDTVLLDLDGTLLDLHFDNYFWSEHLPRCYAEQHSLDPDEAKTYVAAELNKHRGKLSWYLTDGWSRRLQVDIVALKQQVAAKIKIRDSVMPFLAFLKTHNKRRFIATNADHNSLVLKFAQTGIDKHVDAVYSSESFGIPKEDQGYWQALRIATGFDPARTLFIDDNLTVLHAARSFGIGHLIAVSRPDSQLPAREIHDYHHVEHFDGLHREWSDR